MRLRWDRWMYRVRGDRLSAARDPSSCSSLLVFYPLVMACFFLPKVRWKFSVNSLANEFAKSAWISLLQMLTTFNFSIISRRKLNRPVILSHALIQLFCTKFPTDPSTRSVSKTSVVDLLTRLTLYHSGDLYACSLLSLCLEIIMFDVSWFPWDVTRARHYSAEHRATCHTWFQGTRDIGVRSVSVIDGNVNINADWDVV